MRDAQFAYKRTVAPSAFVLPVTLEECKEEIGILDDDTQDNRIRRLIRTATKHIENDSRIIVMTQTYQLYLDRFPSDVIEIRRCPVASLTHVKYYLDDVLTTWAAANYQTDIITEPARLWPVNGQYWPTADVNKFNAVQIEFVAGYASASVVPDEIKDAILHAVRQAYFGCPLGTNYWLLINRLQKFGWVV